MCDMVSTGHMPLGAEHAKHAAGTGPDVAGVNGGSHWMCDEAAKRGHSVPFAGIVRHHHICTCPYNMMHHIMIVGNSFHLIFQAPGAPNRVKLAGVRANEPKGGHAAHAANAAVGG